MNVTCRIKRRQNGHDSSHPQTDRQADTTAKRGSFTSLRPSTHPSTDRQRYTKTTRSTEVLSFSSPSPSLGRWLGRWLAGWLIHGTDEMRDLPGTVPTSTWLPPAPPLFSGVSLSLVTSPVSVEGDIPAAALWRGEDSLPLPAPGAGGAAGLMLIWTSRVPTAVRAASIISRAVSAGMDTGEALMGASDVCRLMLTVFLEVTFLLAL
mmetsp:Transcript_7372/g.18016  ORF Transcript_7372/g.18016 Transcript_7372/m.18016 type:complete len:207 (+) Transcript_7372:592-1212(+)